MAHAISVRNGKVEMAALEGISVWWDNPAMRAGRLQPGDKIERWLEVTGMGIQLQRVPVQYELNGKTHTSLESQVICRPDTGEQLGLVSVDYKLVQPAEVLEFYRDLVSENGFRLTTAGLLFGGRRYWAAAAIGAEAYVAHKSDRVGGYLLLNTSCDGSSATEGRITDICVVCSNTLQQARGAKPEVRVSHRETFDHAKVKTQLGVAHEDFNKFIKDARALANVKIDKLKFDAWLQALMVTAKMTTVTEPAQITKLPAFNRIRSLFEGAGKGSDLTGRAGTAWGAVNAVTEYFDHWAPRSTTDHRLESAWFGDGAKAKDAAMSAALVLV